MNTEREKVIKALECVICPTKLCGGCSYFIRNENDPDTGWCNRDAIYKDALSLLKAQEPRVMDADEIVLSAEPSGWLWLEMKNGHCGESFKAGRTISGWINFGNGFDSSFASFLPKEYGKTWRCWTTRPSDSERGNTPWE